MAYGIMSLIDYETTKLVIEGVAICVLYLLTMLLLILCKKEWWIQEYPGKVRKAYLLDKQHDEGGKKEERFFWRLLIKKAIALVIYIAVMLALAGTVELRDIFVMESFRCCIIFWPAVTLMEAIFLDVLAIGHWKKIRLCGTENLHEEYRGIYKKAGKDILLGLAFGIVVYAVLFGIFMVTIRIELEKNRKELAELERQIEALENGTYMEDYGEALYGEEYADNSYWDEQYEQLQESASELNEIANDFAEIVENIKQVVEYKEESATAEHLNDGRKIVRERPVFEGESLWSIAQKVYGNPNKWQDVYEANKTILGDNPALIYKNQFLTLPDTGEYDYTGYEYCYEEIVSGTGDWEGLTEYIDPDCGYEVQNCIFYYNSPEGNGEQFRVCYPKLISLNGKDVTAINEELRQRALINADYMMLDRDEEFASKFDSDDRYSTEWIQDQVNYVITYLDSDTISVVFQYYLFEGSIYAEYLELRTCVADINTGKRYTTTELLANLDDGKLAETVNEKILAFYEEREKEFQTWSFTEVMTPELINETLQTGLIVNGRYYSNIYVTPDGVGVGFTYRMNKDSKILRGWKAITIPREEAEAYLTDASVWK